MNVPLDQSLPAIADVVDFRIPPSGLACDPQLSHADEDAQAVAALERLVPIPNKPEVLVWERFCSAVLVSPNTAITAAHCTRWSDAKRLRVVFGSEITHADPPSPKEAYNGTCSGSECANVECKDEFKWKESKFDPLHLGVGDVAYLHLDRRIQDIRPARISRAAIDKLEATNVNVVGFGASITRGDGQGRQQTVAPRRCVVIPIADTCDDSFDANTPGVGTVQGDSGGAVFDVHHQRVRLVGLTAWSSRQDGNGFTVFSALHPEYKAFIREAVERETYRPPSLRGGLSLYALAVDPNAGLLKEEYSITVDDNPSSTPGPLWGRGGTAELWFSLPGIGTIRKGAIAAGPVLSVDVYRTGGVSGRTDSRRSYPFWGADLSQTFSVNRSVVDYSVGAAFQFRRDDFARPYGSIALGVRRTVNLRTGRYATGDTGGRCDLFEVSREEETSSPFYRARNCDTEMRLRNFVAVVGVEMSRRTWPLAIRAFARFTQIHTDPLYAIGVGLSWYFPRL